jgi:hypothetical protein
MKLIARRKQVDPIEDYQLTLTPEEANELWGMLKHAMRNSWWGPDTVITRLLAELEQRPRE